VPKRNADHLDRKIDQISDQLPESAGAFLRWLRTPSSRWVRVPLALLLIVGGVVGFLPVLGFWMIPLGLLLLAQDVPFLQRPILRSLTWLERKWINWGVGFHNGGQENRVSLSMPGAIGCGLGINAGRRWERGVFCVEALSSFR
jgi:hypothetical protein